MNYALPGCAIATSNYTKWKKDPQVRVGALAISRFAPKYFIGPEFPMLFPPLDLLGLYKDHGITDEGYRRWYGELLECMNPFTTARQLVKAAGNTNKVVLLCYEADGDFCHRHLAYKRFARFFEHQLGEI